MGKKKTQLILGIALAIGAVAYAGYQYKNDPQRGFEAGKAALKAGDLKVVEQKIDFLADYPRYAAHRNFLRGSMFLRQGALEEAFQEFGFCIQHPDLEVESLVLAGQTRYQAKQVADAQVLWRRALRIDPECLDAHRWLGVLCYDVGAMDNAIDHFKVISEKAPNDPRPDRMRGMIYWMYNRPGEAVEFYRESLKRSTNQHDVEQIYLELAECEGQIREYRTELATLAKCKERSSRRLTLEAEAHYALGEIDQAEKLLDEALQNSPDGSKARLLKGKILLDQQKPQEAAEILREAVAHNPVDDEAFSNLATALRILGKDEEAKQTDEKATKYRELWRRFYKLHTQAIAEPNNASYRFELGGIAKELLRLDLARSWYEATLAIDPGHEEAFRELKKLLEAEQAALTSGSVTSPTAR